jgi:hypothetical protein
MLVRYIIQLYVSKVICAALADRCLMSVAPTSFELYSADSASMRGRLNKVFFVMQPNNQATLEQVPF